MAKNTIAEEVTFKIYLRWVSKAMTNKKKRGEDKNIKFNYFKNEKRFLDEIKSIFHNPSRAIILV